MIVGMALGGTGVSFDGVGDGLALGDLVGDGVAAGVAAEVFRGVALAVGFAVDCPTGPVEPADVPAAATAEANALAPAESAGAEPTTPGEEIAALGSALDAAAAAAGPDDAALLLCDELEHPERASAATIVTPINPVTRKRTLMAFPPEGMRQQ